jgi:hypothetical protein
MAWCASAGVEQSLPRLPLELQNGLLQIPAHELRVPVDPVQGARHDVLLCRVDRPGDVSIPSAGRRRRAPDRAETPRIAIGALSPSDGKEPLGDVDEDGSKAIAAYRAARRGHATSSVTVLDFGAVEAHPGGAYTERVHTVVEARVVT